MKKRILSMLMAIAMVISLLPTAAWATNSSGTISSNVTWNDGDVIDSAVTLSGGSEGTPMVVTVSGTVTVNAEICVTGNVRITGGTLVRGAAGSAKSMLKVSSGAQLTLDNITVCGNDVSVDDGNAIYVSGGSLEINEGTTLCHHLNSHTNGSAIKAQGGLIEMNGGLIENNTVQSYGTIYLNDYAEFEFNGGVIRNNIRTGSTQYGGGAFYVRYGRLTMNGGTISGHDVGEGYGGAIYCTSYGTVKLNGGSITENHAQKGDAIFYSSQQGRDAEMYIGGNPYIAGSIHLDNSQATKYPYITSVIKNPLTLVVDADTDTYTQDRIIAVGHAYSLTESDMAKITLSVLNDSTPYYAELDSTNNRLLMANTDPGYTEKYYVTYLGNGGTGSTLDDTAYNSTQAAIVMVNGFQREGYTFSCWNTKADGTGTSYTPGDSISMSEDVTLYAIWQNSNTPPVTTYTVTWYNEDGTTVLETATWAYGSVPSFTKRTPAKEDDAENTYAFKEWVAMSGLDSDGKVTGDASFKASYTATKIDYTGTVSPEEGTMENVTAGGLGEVAEEINKNIVLTVKVDAADANDTEQTAIKGQAGSRTLEFLDITLKDDGGNSVEVPQSTVLEIAIPFTVGNKQNITVYRHHNGTAAAFTALNTKPNADARTDATFYVDSENNKIYIYTNQFSTYAIGYTVPSSATAGSYTPTYAIAVEKSENGEVKTNRSYASGSSMVTLTVIPDTGYTLETLRVIDKNGKEVELTNKGDGKYTFKMPASKVTVKAAFAVENPFEDVSSDAYYYDAVLWAVKVGITRGTSATTFSPDNPCTRAQMVTFLWNSAGRPEPSGDDCAFNDVSKDSYYEKAVRWAYENGITKGTSETTFSPDMECSRAHMATFLCQMADGKAESDTNAFVDVKSNAYYADSVQWAVENGITKGTGNNKYSPDATCTRGQMVTFLYQYYNK